MAEVLRAELVGAEGFSRPVAIKRILPTLSENPSFGKMFVNEARIASLLSHPNVVSVVDFDRDGEGRYFLVMELVEGIDLRTLASSGRLPISVVIHLCAEICRGLAYAHERVHEGKHLAIVHRDMSPHNVMLSWSGAVKVVDFGIAKIMAATDASRSGTLKGKIAYMSPEQAHGHELDGRSDVFAVGVMLHELLTGERLFSGASEPEILARLLTQPIARPREFVSAIPEDVDALVMSLLARNREERMGSARAAAEALISCSAASTRAPLELREILRDRFPDRAPLSADVSGPVRAAAISQPVAQLDSGQTETAGQTSPGYAPPLHSPSPLPSPVASAHPGHPTPRIAAPADEKRNPWPMIVAALLVVLGITLGVGLMKSRGSAVEEAANGLPSAPQDAASADAPVDAAPVDASAPADAQVADAAMPDAAATTPPDGAPPEASADAAVTPREAPRKVRAKGPPGYLSVVVRPWAKVSTRGLPNTTTPITKFELPPGSYRVRLQNDDLKKSERVPIRIRSGKTTVIRRNWD